MKIRDHIRRVQRETLERASLSEKKGMDYASAEDTLANFKQQRAVCAALDIDPRRSAGDAALCLLVVKLIRLQNLRRSGAPPQNESIDDTYKDFHNYLDLCHSCDIDDEQERWGGIMPYSAFIAGWDGERVHPQ